MKRKQNERKELVAASFFVKIRSSNHKGTTSLARAVSHHQISVLIKENCSRRQKVAWRFIFESNGRLNKVPVDSLRVRN